MSWPLWGWSYNYQLCKIVFALFLPLVLALQLLAKLWLSFRVVGLGQVLQTGSGGKTTEGLAWGESDRAKVVLMEEWSERGYNAINPGLLLFLFSIERKKSLLLDERRSLNKAPVLEALGA